MKKLIIITVIFLGYFLTTSEASSRFRYNRHYYSMDVDYFFDALEPYGEWIEIGYDEYVWRPDFVGYNWKPYSEGRWEWTRNGWHWVSYEPFGWATYHYGRWFYDDFYGWVWMPDNVWAPAWVEWRNNNNYIGWAPLPPYASFNRRRGIYFSVRWNSGYNHWNFVTYNNFCSINVNNYYVDNYTSRNIYRRTKHRTNYYDRNNSIVNGGIDRRYVERKSGRKIRTRDVVRTKSTRNLTKRNSTNRREVVSYRPNSKELRKTRKIDRSKITKGRKLKSLKRDKVTIRSPREINKTNRREIPKKRNELRKNNKNKTYKPIVRRSEIGKRKSKTNTRLLKNNRKLTNKRTTNKETNFNSNREIRKKNTRSVKRVESKMHKTISPVKRERKVTKRKSRSTSSSSLKKSESNDNRRKKVIRKRTKLERSKS